jgi:hypothetical protein
MFQEHDHELSLKAMLEGERNGSQANSSAWPTMALPPEYFQACRLKELTPSQKAITIRQRYAFEPGRNLQ